MKNVGNVNKYENVGERTKKYDKYENARRANNEI